jgi:cell pole-organizing protein PopZ
VQPLELAFGKGVEVDAPNALLDTRTVQPRRYSAYDAADVSAEVRQARAAKAASDQACSFPHQLKDCWSKARAAAVEFVQAPTSRGLTA